MTNTTQSAAEAIMRIQQQAERIKSDRTQRFSEAASVGDSWRQGDLYITKLASVPEGCIVIEKPDRQLAPGNSKGSRHCLSKLKGTRVFRFPKPGELDGHVLEIGDGGNVVTHPEHGNVVLPKGVYGISYQRDLDAEDRERRVLD